MPGNILNNRARNLSNTSQRTDQTTEHGGLNRFYDLPIELLLSLIPHLHSLRDIKNLASVSRVFHHIFGQELYKECHRRLDYLPLFIGAMEGDIKLLGYFLKYGQQIDPIWTDKKIPHPMFVYPNHRPIHVAIEHGQVDTVDWLLAKGANPNQSENLTELDYCRTPLQICMEMASGILATNPDMNEPTQLRIFRALLKSGADPNVKDKFYDYPLRQWLTSEMGDIRKCIPYISLLLFYKANPLQLCKYYNTKHKCSFRSELLGSRPPADSQCVQDVGMIIDQQGGDILAMRKHPLCSELLSDEEFELCQKLLFTIACPLQLKSQDKFISSNRMLYQGSWVYLLP